MATTAPAAIDALMTLATAHVPAGTACFEGHPGTTEAEAIFTIGGTGSPTVTWESASNELGARSRDEHYSILCTASIGRGGDESMEASVRNDTWAIVQAIEVALKNDPTLDGTVRYAQIIHGSAQGTGPDEAAAGRLVFITFYVKCEARVTFT